MIRSWWTESGRDSEKSRRKTRDTIVQGREDKATERGHGKATVEEREQMRWSSGVGLGGARGVGGW